MNIKAFLFGLLFLPSAAWAQGIPADKEAQDLFQFYRKFFIQTPGRMHDLNVLRDGTVLHGFIQIGGTSTTITTDPVSLAQSIATTVKTFFGIPNDYQWVLKQGGFIERRPIETVGTWKNVVMVLMVDDVPVEGGYVEIMLDETGHLRTLTISMPRLRPEIVSAVRGPTKTSFEAAVAIRLDANALPPDNQFAIKPNTDLKYVDLRKVALAQDPYIVYMTFVNRAQYIVNAKTGQILRRVVTATQ